jgi:hypothetical protein
MAEIGGFPWDAWVFIGVIVLFVFAVGWGYYTRIGSGINEHPVDDRGSSPVARGPASVSGAGRVPEASSDGQAVSSHRDTA